MPATAITTFAFSISSAVKPSLRMLLISSEKAATTLSASVRRARASKPTNDIVSASKIGW